MERILRKRPKGDAVEDAELRKRVDDIRSNLPRMKSTERVLVNLRASLDIEVAKLEKDTAELQESIEHEVNKRRQLQNFTISTKAMRVVVSDPKVPIRQDEANISQLVTMLKPGVVPDKELPSKQYVCMINSCGLRFELVSDLSAHMSSMHKNATHQCNFDGCKKRLASPRDLRLHWRTHTGEKHFSCDFEDCRKPFSRFKSLKHHRRNHTGENPFSCGQCDRTFRLSASLTTHKSICKRRPKFKKQFRREMVNNSLGTVESKLQPNAIELDTASPSNPLICKVTGCGLQFKLIIDLSAHLSSKHMNANLQCNSDGCEKRLASAANLIQHWRTHTGEKPFKCDFADCGRTFGVRNGLVEHHRTHTGEKPFPCAHCGKTFRTRSYRGAHELTHLKLKNFSCDEHN